MESSGQLKSVARQTKQPAQFREFLETGWVVRVIMRAEIIVCAAVPKQCGLARLYWRARPPRPRVILTVASAADLYYTTEAPSPPLPYAFAYSAGRAPGHIDRTHSESSDGSGVIRGQFSYVDPRYKVRTVSYTADAQGFHPELSDPVQDTRVVAEAKQRHLDLFQKIAAEHEAIQAQRALEYDPQNDDPTQYYNQKF